MCLVGGFGFFFGLLCFYVSFKGIEIEERRVILMLVGGLCFVV